jgi:hypothetical protein
MDLPTEMFRQSGRVRLDAPHTPASSRDNDPCKTLRLSVPSWIDLLGNPFVFFMDQIPDQTAEIVSAVAMAHEFFRHLKFGIVEVHVFASDPLGLGFPGVGHTRILCASKQHRSNNKTD